MTWAPQGKGTPGWLYLTRNPGPIAYFIVRNDTPTPSVVNVVWDERCFEDTIIRAEKTSTHLYLADVWMFNGVQMFDNTLFEDRQLFLEKIYKTFYTPCPSFETYSILLRSQLTDIRGKEYYTSRGSKGIFVENEDNVFEISRTDIPDVYKLSNGEYLRVKTLKLSRYLAALGHTFTLACENNGDGTWTPIVPEMR